MKTWDDWSDVDINRAVATARGQKVIQQSMFNIGRIWIVEGWDGGIYEIPDYCNNPAYMWPIIVENRIAVIEPDGMKETKWSAGQVYGMAKWYSDDNPLRAAAIVFLIMNGLKPE